MENSSSLQLFSEKYSTFSENNINPSSQTTLIFSRSGNDRFTNDTNEKKHKKKNTKNKNKNKKKQVFLERYVEANKEDELNRTKSLTDDDLEELKGCLDLGFGFNYDEIPELCNTLPALDLCYSMSQKYHDQQHKLSDSLSDDTTTSSASASSFPNWKISSPGDDPEDVKARLKYWAQAVACTVKLCS